MGKKTKKEYTNTPKVEEPKITATLDENETFMIVNIEEKWRIGINGQWLSKEIFKSKEDAQTYINNKPWELIMNLAGVIAEYVISNNSKNK